MLPSLRSIAVLGIAGVACPERAADAAEGASSHYLPGTAGDLGYALTPANGTWLHDLHADNRFDSNYGLLTVAWKF